LGARESAIPRKLRGYAVVSNGTRRAAAEVGKAEHGVSQADLRQKTRKGRYGSTKKRGKEPSFSAFYGNRAKNVRGGLRQKGNRGAGQRAES